MSAEAKVTVSEPARPPHAALAWLIVLFAVGCLAVAPPSRLAPMALAEWHDQQIFLRAVTQTLEQGLPDADTQSLVGPAYIALTIVVGWITGLAPADALVLLSRLTFGAAALIVAGIAMQYRVRVSLGFQVVLALVAVAALWTSVWFRATDLPWTHFVAAVLLGAIVLTSLTRLPLVLRAGIIGTLAIALVQTRLFEAQVAAIAGALIIPLAAARYWPVVRAKPLVILQVVAPFVVGGAIAFVAIGAVSHNWSLYQQYGSVEGMVLTPELAPLKAVQLFWDTCFGVVCEFAAAPVGASLENSLDSWRQPLMLQLPGLIGAALGFLTLALARPGRVLRMPLGVLFAVIAGGGLLVAYVSGGPSGSSHLKYGFFRDFVPPLILFACALIAALAVQRAEDGRTTRALVVPIVVFLAVTGGLSALRSVGLPQLEGGHVARFEVSSACAGTECTFALVARDGAGEAMPYPEVAYVTCDGAPMVPPVRRVSDLRLDPSVCRHVAILPLASGLLYTPEEDAFLGQPLNLGLSNDTASVP